MKGMIGIVKNVIRGSMKSEDERLSCASRVCVLYYMSLR